MYFRTGICQERQVHIVKRDRENRIGKGCCSFNFHKNWEEHRNGTWLKENAVQVQNFCDFEQQLTHH